MKTPPAVEGFDLTELLLKRTQGGLRLIALREKARRKFDRGEWLPRAYIGKRDVIERYLTAVEPLEDKENVFPIRAPTCIAVTAHAVYRINNTFLAVLRIVQVQVAEAIITD